MTFLSLQSWSISLNRKPELERTWEVISVVHICNFNDKLILVKRPKIIQWVICRVSSNSQFLLYTLVTPSCFNSLGHNFPEMLSLNTLGKIESVYKAVLKRHLVYSWKSIKPQPILYVLKGNEGMDFAFVHAYLLIEGTFWGDGGRHQLKKNRESKPPHVPHCLSVKLLMAIGTFAILHKTIFFSFLTFSPSAACH